MKEVNREEFDQALEKELQRARNYAKGEIDYAYWFSFNEVGGPRSTPCIYTDSWVLAGEWTSCPLTGKAKRLRLLPKDFKSEIKPNVVLLRHGADINCIGMNTHQMVRCYCQTDDGFFITVHRIGRCPWKEK